MEKIRRTLIILVLISSFGFSQSKSEIENLLNGISTIENSKEIIKTKQAEKLIEYGWRILPTLAEFFSDKTLTEIKSECNNRILNKGEIEEWEKRLLKEFNTKLEKVDSFDNPDVLAQFDPNTKSIKYKDDVTEYIMAHESYHAEEMSIRSKSLYW